MVRVWWLIHWLSSSTCNPPSNYTNHPFNHPNLIAQCCFSSHVALTQPLNKSIYVKNLVGSTKRCWECGCRLFKLLAWLTCEHEKFGEKERAEWIRGNEESSRREHINKLHFTHLSPHPAGIWRAPQKLLPETHVSWLHTHKQILSHALPASPFLLAPSFIDSLTTFSFSWFICQLL